MWAEKAYENSFGKKDQGERGEKRGVCNFPLFLSVQLPLPTLGPCPAIMVSFRQFRPGDLNRISKCNLDPLTETYDLGFYLQYHAKWPSLFQVAEDERGNIVGYSTSTS